MSSLVEKLEALPSSFGGLVVLKADVLAIVRQHKAEQARGVVGELESILRDMRTRDYDCAIHTNWHGTGVSFTHPRGWPDFKVSLAGEHCLLAAVVEARQKALSGTEIPPA